MGGGSSVNVQAANRGLPRDYDEWAELGATGWAWDDVLPYFIRLENDLDCGGPLHGKTVRSRSGASCRLSGRPSRKRRRRPSPPATSVPHDQNGEFGDGLFPPAFLQPGRPARVDGDGLSDDARCARGRTCVIWAETQVTKLLLAGPRAEGIVATRRDGTEAKVRARRVVVTAGALQTPAILMRAGIGAGAHLRDLGIQVTIDRAGRRPEPAATTRR